jgi:hypothetical protein
MATGKVAAVALSAAANTSVYTVPVGKVFTGKINVCNRNATVAKVRIAYSTSVAPLSGEYVEYDVPLTPTGTVGNVIERSGECLGSGESVWAYSDTSNVDVVVQGYEE